MVNHAGLITPAVWRKSRRSDRPLFGKAARYGPTFYRSDDILFYLALPWRQPARCCLQIFIHQNGSKQKENTNIQTNKQYKNTLITHYVHSQSVTVCCCVCLLRCL